MVFSSVVPDPASIGPGPAHPESAGFWHLHRGWQWQVDYVIGTAGADMFTQISSATPEVAISHGMRNVPLGNHGYVYIMVDNLETSDLPSIIDMDYTYEALLVVLEAP